MLRIHAGSVHPVTAPPIEDGAVLVDDRGTIAAVGPHSLAPARLGARGIYYQEVFGPDPAQCAASMEELRRALDRLSPLATSPLSLGVSPHAPYTVSEPLYRAVADLARRERCPLAMHLAESRAETELVRDGSGPFADALRARGFAVRAQHCS